MNDRTTDAPTEPMARFTLYITAPLTALGLSTFFASLMVLDMGMHQRSWQSAFLQNGVELSLSAFVYVGFFLILAAMVAFVWSMHSSDRSKRQVLEAVGMDSQQASGERRELR